MKVPTPRKLPSNSWFIQLRLGGESISFSAATEKECKKQATLIKAEHVAGKHIVSQSELTLREALERYIARKELAGASPSTIRGYEYRQASLPGAYGSAGLPLLGLARRL